MGHAQLPFDSIPTPMTSLIPSFSPGVHLGLTVTMTVLYGTIFLLAYIQLLLMRWFHYKRISYQTIFLAMCLLFSSLRLIFFSFYFCNSNNHVVLPDIVIWLLLCFPVAVHYAIFALIISFYVKVLYKSHCSGYFYVYRWQIQACLAGSTVLFFIINLVIGLETIDADNMTSYWLVTVRVVISDSFFLILAALLSICIRKISQISNTLLILEARGITKCKALVSGLATILLFITRAVYNVLALCTHLPGFQFNWIDVTDQADFTDLGEESAYFSYGLVLFLWEIVPTFFLLYLFQIRLHCCRREMVRVGSSEDARVVGDLAAVERSYFFSNVGRYDSLESGLGGNPSSGSMKSNNGLSSLYSSGPHKSSSEMRSPAGSGHLAAAAMASSINAGEEDASSWQPD